MASTLSSLTGRSVSGSVAKRCKGLNRFAQPCKFHGSEIDGYCWRHRDDPYQEERRQRQARNAERDDYHGVARIIRQNSAWSRVEAEMYREGMTMADYVATLPLDKLVTGRLGDHGVAAKWIPAEFHQACIKELLKRGDKIFREAYIDAITVMQQIAKDPEAKEADRLKAATFIIERVAGKTPERLEVSEVQPWEKLITDIVNDNDELQAMKRAAGLLADE